MGRLLHLGKMCEPCAGEDSKENIAELMQASAKAQAASGAEPGTSEHKRRGDMEFENQLAMALQVRAAPLSADGGGVQQCSIHAQSESPES